MFNFRLTSIPIILAFSLNVAWSAQTGLVIRLEANENDSKVLNASLLKNELEGQLSRHFQIQFHQKQPQREHKGNFSAKVDASLTFEKSQQSAESNSIRADSKGNSNPNSSPPHDLKETQTSETKVSKESKTTAKVDIAIPEIHTLEELSEISKALGIETIKLPDSNATEATYPKKIFKNLNISVEESNWIISTGASYLLIINGFRSKEKIDSTKTKFFQGTRRQRLSELDFTFASIATDRILRKDKISATQTTLSGKPGTIPRNTEKTNQTLGALVKKLAKSINETLEVQPPTEQVPKGKP